MIASIPINWFFTVAIPHPVVVLVVNLVVFTGVERARFRRPVIPGDQLRIEVDVLAWRRIAGRMGGKVFVDGKLVAEAVISCPVVDRPGKPGSSSSAADTGTTE